MDQSIGSDGGRSGPCREIIIRIFRLTLLIFKAPIFIIPFEN